MALPARAVSLKPFNLASTVRTLPSGVPSVPGINLYAKVYGADHGHDHGHSLSRSDVPPSWASGIRLGGGSKFESRTVMNAPVSRGMHTSTKVPSANPYSVPDWSHYKTESPSMNRAFSYFMVGSMGLLGASAAKATVTDFLATMAASADVLALAKVEVSMSAIPLAKNVIIKWRGKPVFIRHRTAAEIDDARHVDLKSLRDPETDEARTKRPEWLVMLGVCTHLGCVPIGESGDYGGWFCPCHGSHYDISGRARKGPAPLNLEIPPYDFNDAEEKIIIG
ncbi:ubiquinol-cytochrome c reductase iron-sulfur subunit mitochondrial precursor [Dacryopinax primogenitus]|uniref:Cytochrome b-c1 complex subunit Rieske, mitochondrial n=1 Tax=Dacryopinax primogenitus (strain DJM 731) TaxID=1858805 RepID=M5FS66_DACPD|nr:ubiquinol-cytochrome c reductase iron-sulfur subunit mitochondrial precursor [Dacryopinax primogenitus]EJT97989.1 ubiquinol-cytochrome c reductase iron-sulfur subunit mitochondrial precursor [Dacryopinax primogenitus]